MGGFSVGGFSLVVVSSSKKHIDSVAKCIVQFGKLNHRYIALIIVKILTPYSVVLVKGVSLIFLKTCTMGNMKNLVLLIVQKMWLKTYFGAK